MGKTIQAIMKAGNASETFPAIANSGRNHSEIKSHFHTNLARLSIRRCVITRSGNA